MRDLSVFLLSPSWSEEVKSPVYLLQARNIKNSWPNSLVQCVPNSLHRGLLLQWNPNNSSLRGFPANISKHTEYSSDPCSLADQLTFVSLLSGHLRQMLLYNNILCASIAPSWEELREDVTVWHWTSAKRCLRQQEHNTWWPVRCLYLLLLNPTLHIPSGRSSESHIAKALNWPRTISLATCWEPLLMAEDRIQYLLDWGTGLCVSVQRRW